MPELPEVETIISDLQKLVIGKKITKLEVFLPRIVKGDLNQFLTNLIDNKFRRIERRGKLIIFVLQKHNLYLLIHLRMTGQLVYCQQKKIIAGGHSDKKIPLCERNQHTRAEFQFADKSRLYFNDLRTFGSLRVVDENQLAAILKKFGKDALARDFDFSYLKNILKSKSASIKALLLNQKLIAGIGNIYADEALFQAGILPARKGNSLKDAEIKRLAASIKRVLRKAVKYRGTTFNSYVDSAGKQGKFKKLLKVYGRAHEKCARCGCAIKKSKVAQRGTHYCEKCQK